MLPGNARDVDGLNCIGAYLWIEMENIKRLEDKIVYGSRTRRYVSIHKNMVPVLYEACKYIHVAPDLYDSIEEQVCVYLKGEQKWRICRKRHGRSDKTWRL